MNTDPEQNNLKPLILKEYQSLFHPRKKDANKGSFGHVLIIGGDYGMGGAVRLAGEAALRAGAGLVTIATRKEHAYAICAARPELMCYGIDNEVDDATKNKNINININTNTLESLILRANVIVIGNGLGKDNWGKSLLEAVLETDKPLVVDGDALNILSTNPRRRTNWVLTPHPGEAGRLLQKSITQIQKDRVQAVQFLKQYYDGIIVLKGAGTLILGEEENPIICNQGNPGMATAGMGDVLAGIIGGLIAQGLSLHLAACLGVAVHAEAGDLVAEKGERGMIARDVICKIRQCVNP